MKKKLLSVGGGAGLAALHVYRGFWGWGGVRPLRPPPAVQYDAERLYET